MKPATHSPGQLRACVRACVCVKVKVVAARRLAVYRRVYSFKALQTILNQLS